MNLSSSVNGLFENNSGPNNEDSFFSFFYVKKQRTLSDIITNFRASYTSKMTTIEIIRDALKTIKSAYPNKDEIPLIKIKDENYFESGEKIENYINNLVEFDDSKFNKCAIYKENQNNYFCENCHINICDICYKICKSNNHILINLFEKVKLISDYIINIRKIFAEYFIILDKEKNKSGIIKKNKNYDFSDEYEMNNEIDEKPMDYTFDIILIEALLKKFI